MRYAKIFGENEERLIDALDIKNGIESKKHQFVDPEYEFRVDYVSGSKNNGNPYFRLYYSKKDYLKFSEERKRKYDILSGMKHVKESHWHKNWKNKLQDFMEIEKYVKNPKTNKYKYADGYYKDGSLVVELQHSYIDNDFDARNDFYKSMDLTVVWLFDLTSAKIKKENGIIELLEDNSKGFFKVAEECNSLYNYPIYVHFSDDNIYRVKELKRKEINGELESTIRFFNEGEAYSINTFLSVLKQRKYDVSSKEFVDLSCRSKSLFQIYKENNSSSIKGLQLVVRDTENGGIYKFFKNPDTGMLSIDFITNKITYLECYYYNGELRVKANNFKKISKYECYKEKWELLHVITF